MRKLGLCVLLVLAVCPSWADDLEVNPDLLEKPWSAKWVRAADSSDTEYGVYFFRRAIEVEEAPNRFVVHVSADCRYKLFVNGSQVSVGPAAGDYYHWNFETVDLAPFLTDGRNVLSAVVWNGGENRPESQISYRTGFILQGDGASEQVVDTGIDWKGAKSSGHAPVWGIGHAAYYVCGPGEERDLRAVPDGWKNLDFDDSQWGFVEEVPLGMPLGGKPKGIRDAAGWMLVPRSIPEMEMTKQRFQSVREADGVDDAASILAEGGAVQIDAHSKVRLLLDNGVLTNAYPRLEFSGGRDARIELVYAESLFESIPEYDAPLKGKRDEVAGKVMEGRRDRVIGRGGEGQVFEPLSWRTFRFVEVTVVTGEEALILKEVGSVFTGYPFELNSRFESDGSGLDEILEIGWRTARLCAVETYMDCPYYEQLQYIGDARIQALVSLYNSGDDRLLKNALNLMDQSRIAEGVTMSRHPSKTPQIISTFSLWYIGMLHDYWMYGSDASFVERKLEGARGVLSFFHRFQGEDGRLSRPPYWLFTDWVEDGNGWDFGEAPFGEDKESSVMDLTLLWAYQLAAEMEAELGMPAFAELYAERADTLKASIRGAYWDIERGVMKDTESGETLSQHANALAILTGTLSEAEASRLAPILKEGKGMAKATIYFKYYLHLALTEAGLGSEYLSWLGKWRENIAMGLTTWAEKSEVESSRSDCHAWGSSPNVEFYRIVLGIDSAAPGFREVRIEPRLGGLTRASGTIPHPEGELGVSYLKTGDGWEVAIELPGKVSGTLVWDGELHALIPGANEFRF